MTVRDLIKELLHYDMEDEVRIDSRPSTPEDTSRMLMYTSLSEGKVYLR